MLRTSSINRIADIENPELSGVSFSTPAASAIESAQEIIRSDSLVVGKDRAMFFSRSEMLINEDQSRLNHFSENERLVLKYLEFLNSGLGWDMCAEKNPPTGINPYQCLASMRLGAAIDRLSQVVDTKLSIEFGGKVLNAGTLASNNYLVNEISNQFAKSAAGIVWLAVHNSAPNTFFRCQEMETLMRNPEVNKIALIVDEPERYPSVILQTKADWHYKQKDSWWNYSLAELNQFQGNSHSVSTIRFIGEIFHTVKELERLSSGAPYSNENIDRAKRAEYERVTQAIIMLNRLPVLAERIDNIKLAHALAKMFVYELPPDAKEREYVLGRKFCDTSIDFVNDSVRKLFSNLERHQSQRTHR